MMVAELDALTVMDTIARVIPTAATTKTWEDKGQTSIKKRGVVGSGGKQVRHYPYLSVSLCSYQCKVENQYLKHMFEIAITIWYCEMNQYEFS